MRRVGDRYALIVASHGSEFIVALDSDGHPERGRVTKTWHDPDAKPELE